MKSPIATVCCSFLLILALVECASASRISSNPFAGWSGGAAVLIDNEGEVTLQRHSSMSLNNGSLANLLQVSFLSSAALQTDLLQYDHLGVYDASGPKSIQSYDSPTISMYNVGGSGGTLLIASLEKPASVPEPSSLLLLLLGGGGAALLPFRRRK